jgi:type II secretory pathway component PulM
MIYQKKLLWGSGLFLVATLVAVYILQINALTALAYHIADNEDRLQQLKEQHTDLQAQVRQSATLSDLEQLAFELSFEKISSISYVRVLNTSVAQNQ